ncbi:hypothetical protein [Actinomadura sp. HBU206391]|uniref:hypothetical protein n=1 Tax=Actinomadura sp. HBU206391 TaxID=2731692 RepID=UPI00164F1075|nr:hypothetical protein [Actinomadura sp. HBU206391]MBC6458613.1 hypothetical protein [Actinomadura sp. HBU206391]
MRPSIMRATVLGATALALVLGVSGCGGDDVDKAAMVSKLKSEPDFKEVPSDVADKVVNCMADVALKYGDKADLKSYVDGKIKMDAVKGVGPNDKQSEAEAGKCAEMAVK